MNGSEAERLYVQCEEWDLKLRGHCGGSMCGQPGESSA